MASYYKTTYSKYTNEPTTFIGGCEDCAEKVCQMEGLDPNDAGNIDILDHGFRECTGMHFFSFLLL